MRKEEIDKIIARYLENNTVQEEEEILEQWAKKEENKKKLEELISVNYFVNKEFRKFKGTASSSELLRKSVPAKVRKLNYVKYGAISASVALLISLTFVFSNQNKLRDSETIVNTIIEGGTDKATLTLDDGSEIILEKDQEYIADNLKSNGKELVYSEYMHKSEVKYNYLTVPRGGQYAITLSDGTQVWLNSESKLKYPVSFIDGQTREVELLYGEAYFDVSSSSLHNGDAFRVNHNFQNIQVLGTEFNIKAYEDERIVYTTLVEGKVAVTNDSISKFLLPGQQSSVSKSNKKIEINLVKVSNEIGWVKGEFVFKRKPLEEIFKVLERWYDTEIEITNDELKLIEFTGEFSKNQPLEEILTMIKNTNHISVYTINQNNVTIE